MRATINIGSEIDTIEIKFDWRATFTVIFSEERAVNDIEKAVAKASNDDDDVDFARSFGTRLGRFLYLLALDEDWNLDLVSTGAERMRKERDEAWKPIRRRRVLRCLRGMDELDALDLSAEELDTLSSLDEAIAVRRVQRKDKDVSKWPMRSWDDSYPDNADKRRPDLDDDDSDPRYWQNLTRPRS